ncbi:MAG: hypothetical protein EOO10_13645 [Chitinophagaceae bacterium]|nr:MAG: hypothetical protein EOO10_13645 [Chitinophagaceae bacterium]
MKNILVVAMILMGLSSCKKFVDSVQEDLVIKAMTDGQWRVTSFKRDNTDVTAGFSSYTFQFRQDKTVEAINNGAVESRGTWNGNAENKTIASNFTNAAATLMLLNGTWQITNNSWTYVEATQTINNEVRTLRLDK